MNENVPMIKILQVVGGMNRGGAETWLMHVLRHIDRDRFKMDFLVHTDAPGDYDDEIRALGSEIIVCNRAGRPWKYARQLRDVLLHNGPYDVVHSHVQHFGGLVAAVSLQVGVPRRIVHSHLDTSTRSESRPVMRQAYERLMEAVIKRSCTDGLGVSDASTEALFGRGWRHDPRFRVAYCGVDLTPFKDGAPSHDIRRALGIPDQSLIIGNVGRFVEQKNHSLLLDILAECAVENPRVHLLLIGDGPLRPSIERKAKSLGIREKITFAGVRSDVPLLMQQAMDVFVLPSKFEGLPLVLIEAQAAGLPCLVADNITPEVDIVPELLDFLPLGDLQCWVDGVRKNAIFSDNNSSAQALERVASSSFNILRGCALLEDIYGS